jgi:hypothetical protein
MVTGIGCLPFTIKEMTLSFIPGRRVSHACLMLLKRHRLTA